MSLDDIRALSRTELTSTTTTDGEGWTVHIGEKSVTFGKWSPYDERLWYIREKIQGCWLL